MKNWNLKLNVRQIANSANYLYISANNRLVVEYDTTQDTNKINQSDRCLNSERLLIHLHNPSQGVGKDPYPPCLEWLSLHAIWKVYATCYMEGLHCFRLEQLNQISFKLIYTTKKNYSYYRISSYRLLISLLDMLICS
jgi:hypothetical protein